MIKFYKKLITVSALIGLLLAHTAFAAVKFPTDTGGTLTTGLVSYYKLEDVNDFYGSNNLTNNGGATFGAGKVNNGVVLNGSSQDLSAPSATAPWGTNVWSISMWFKISGSDTLFTLFGNQGNNDGSHGFVIDYGNNNGAGNFGVNKSGVAGFGYAWTPDANWHHLAVVLRSSGTGMELYLDGTSVASNANTGNVVTPTVSPEPFLGARNLGAGGTDAYFNGTIDEVGIWSKSLSTTEISDLYNGGNGQTMCTIGSDCPGGSNHQMSIMWIDEY